MIGIGWNWLLLCKLLLLGSYFVRRSLKLFHHNASRYNPKWLEHKRLLRCTQIIVSARCCHRRFVLSVLAASVRFHAAAVVFRPWQCRPIESVTATAKRLLPSLPCGKDVASVLVHFLVGTTSKGRENQLKHIEVMFQVDAGRNIEYDDWLSNRLVTREATNIEGDIKQWKNSVPKKL